MAVEAAIFRALACVAHSPEDFIFAVFLLALPLQHGLDNFPLLFREMWDVGHGRQRGSAARHVEAVDRRTRRSARDASLPVPALSAGGRTRPKIAYSIALGRPRPATYKPLMQRAPAPRPASVSARRPLTHLLCSALQNSCGPRPARQSMAARADVTTARGMGACHQQQPATNHCTTQASSSRGLVALKWP